MNKNEPVAFLCTKEREKWDKNGLYRTGEFYTERRLLTDAEEVRDLQVYHKWLVYPLYASPQVANNEVYQFRLKIGACEIIGPKEDVMHLVKIIGEPE